MKMWTGYIDVQVSGAGLKFLQKMEVCSGKCVLTSFIEIGGAFYGGQLEQALRILGKHSPCA